VDGLMIELGPGVSAELVAAAVVTGHVGVLSSPVDRQQH
jgi:hypothetical protein